MPARRTLSLSRGVDGSAPLARGSISVVALAGLVSESGVDGLAKRSRRRN